MIREIDFPEAQFQILEFPPAALRPLLVSALKAGVDLAAWVRENRPALDEILQQHSAVIFRGFISSEADYVRFLDSAYPRRVPYEYWLTPRTEVADRVYTSTEYASSQTIPLHVESSYTRSWPLSLILYCAIPAVKGGQTPIACTRAVTRRIPRAVRDEFGRKGVLYVRNYGEHIDVPWRTVFQVSSREELAELCRRREIELRWPGPDRPQTRQVCQGLAKHPSLDEWLWCNQAHLFHLSSLPGPVREALSQLYEEDELPRNAYYGDGTPIEESTLETVRRALAEEEVTFSWERGDLLIVDNMLVHHGRRPFEGERRVLVSFDGKGQGGETPFTD